LLKEAPECNIERIFDKEESYVNMKKISAEMQVAKPLFDIGVKDTDIPTDPIDRLKKAAGMSVIDEVLFSKSSELFTALYDEGLISGNFDYGHTISSSFAFNEISGESSEPETVYARIRDYIEKVKRQGLDRTSFERCKKVIFADFIKGFDSTEEIACEMMSYIFEDCDLFDYADVIKDLDYDYTQKLMTEMFDEDAFALSTVYPVK